MDDRIKLTEVKEKIQKYLDYDLDEYNSDLGRCIDDINFIYKFPEDMVESRTDWDSLYTMVKNAHWAVIELIEVIEKMQMIIEEEPK